MRPGPDWAYAPCVDRGLQQLRLGLDRDWGSPVLVLHVDVFVVK